MSKKIVTDKVVYVEPNMIEDYTSYSSTNHGQVYKSVDLEDMCVVVGLDVEVKGRTYNGGNDVMRMVWSSSVDGNNKISFLKGTKLKTTTGYVDVLTTNFTDTYLSDIEEDGTCEMFGISSIDVNYDNMMVPEVVINFIDVRGVSLFAQEEMRHHLSTPKMTGIADNNIDGSFFKAFFTFPYPRFILYVKGFYGEMVSYELTCSDFRSTFDSNTGNFNVTARFIGYAFSFLNDVMVAGLLAAPYSEYYGKKYWEDSVNNKRFTVTGKNNSEQINMVTLAEICKKYKAIQEEATNALEEIPIKEIAKEVGMTEEEQDILEKSDSKLNDIKNTFTNITSVLDNVYESVNNHSTEGAKNFDVAIKTKKSSFAFICDNKVKELEDIKNSEEIKKLNDLIWNFKYGIVNGLDKWRQENAGCKIELKKINGYSEILENGEINKDKIKDDELRELIRSKGNESYIYNYTRKQIYKDLWEDSSQVYAFETFDLWDAININSDVEVEKSEATKQKMQVRLLNKSFEKIFDFYPTVENITKIVMAHVETFIYMIKQCSDNIINSNTQRSLGNLGIDKTVLSDAGKNNPTRITNDTIVAPFPKITRRSTSKDEPDSNRWQDEWIGSIEGATRDNFEEIKLVEGILNGIADANKNMNIPSNDSTIDSEGGESMALTYPLTYSDLLLNADDSVFGTDINFEDINDIFARFCVRIFSIISLRRYQIRPNYAECGCADAENFLDKFEKTNDLSILSKTIDSITPEKVIDYLTGNGKKLDESKNNNPWYGNSLLTKHSEYQLGITKYLKDENEESIIPTKNWSFKEISNIVDSKNLKLKTKDLKKHYTSTKAIDDSGSDYKSQDIIEARESSVQYFQNRYKALSESKYKGEKDSLFASSSFEFDPEEFASKYNTSNGVIFFDDGQKTVKFSESVGYDSNGDVSILDNKSIDVKDLFINKKFLNQTKQEKAIEFITTVFRGFNINDNELTNTKLLYLPKFSILYKGASLRKNGRPENSGIRPSIYKFFEDYFDNWVVENFDEILDYFTIDFKDVSSIDKVKNIDGIEDFLGLISDNNESKNKFLERYSVINIPQTTTFVSSTVGAAITYNTGEKATLATRQTKKLNKITEDMVRVVCLCIETNHITRLRGNIALGITENNLKGYFGGVIETLKKRIKIPDEAKEEPKVQVNTDPDDIKVGVYNYIKLLYDKWLASNNQKDFYTIEKLFGNGNKNSTFHFIDSFYSKIGQTMYLNLSSIVDRLVESKTNAGYTLLSLLSQLYADNKFLFVCVQNFADFSKEDTMSNMFRPIPYISMAGFPQNTPNFIVLHPYEPSSKLDVEGADYPDDGFYLNDDNQANWPASIREKSGGSPIPAFGVCYGQQYQNYFRNIQVDMNSPMATEQSIKAKFLICGSSTDTGDQGTQVITAGQDLYTIYANNSYTCTVTMMGCAWVQPMMYFVLQNVPMFRGSYMIVKVNHQIQPGFMTTTFKGVRMAATATRAVSAPIFGGTLDSGELSTIRGGDYINNDASNVGYALAEIKNDCKYEYNDPIQREVKIPTSEDAKAYCYATFLLLKQFNSELNDVQAKGICANCLAESTFNPYMVTIDGNSRSHGVGGGLASFYYHGEAKKLFNFVYGDTSKLEELNDKVEPVWRENPVPCSGRNRKKLEEMGIKYTVPFEDQVRFLANRAKDFPGFTACTTESEATIYWCKNYERPAKVTDRWNTKMGSITHGQWVENAISEQRKIDNNTQEIPSGTTIDDFAEGLRKSVESSIRKTSSHKTCVVVAKRVGTSSDSSVYYEYRTEKLDENNILFDCLLNTYENWFNIISWNVENQSVNCDARSVTLNIVDKNPTTHLINVTAVDTNGKKTAQITKKEELNESLRLSLEKYFKNHNTKNGSEIKSIFRSAVASESEVEEWFGITTNTSNIQPCNTCMGDTNNGSTSGLGDFSSQVTNAAMKAILSDVSHINNCVAGDGECCRLYGANYKIQYGVYHSCCTCGPTTWYMRAGGWLPEFKKPIVWWLPQNYKSSTYEATRANLTGRGFKLVWHGNRDDALKLDNSILRPGDICTCHVYRSDGSPSSHAQMWTGKDWRSDAIQRGIWIYGRGTGRQGDYSVCIWRHPDLQ